MLDDSSSIVTQSWGQEGPLPPYKVAVGPISLQTLHSRQSLSDLLIWAHNSTKSRPLGTGVNTETRFAFRAPTAPQFRFLSEHGPGLTNVQISHLLKFTARPYLQLKYTELWTEQVGPAASKIQQRARLIGDTGLEPEFRSLRALQESVEDLSDSEVALQIEDLAARTLYDLNLKLPPVRSYHKIQLVLEGRASPSSSRLSLKAESTVLSSSLGRPFHSDHAGMHLASVALGSNMGNRIGNIETALSAMAAKGLAVTAVSPLYETAPMYVTEQDTFLNGVCQVETELEPLQLLDKLQEIETEMGRERLIENGPRNIDLDVVTYGNERVEHDRLNVPHKLMPEREFVLRPFADIAPDNHLPDPAVPWSISKLLADLEHAFPATPQPKPVTTLSSRLPLLHPTDPTKPTHLMAILNLTPDSFSDGSLHFPTDLPVLTDTISSLLAAGATILDIGGQSTRPHATPISPAEELSRILPTIEHIRSLSQFDNLVISVDTFYASVAEAAIAAGADLINDVTAGVHDPEMLPTVAKLGRSIVLMHMRGTPETMGTLTDYPNGVVAGVGRELLTRVSAAKAAGIPPGVSSWIRVWGSRRRRRKTWSCCGGWGELREMEGLQGYAWLVGPSRKGFVGKVTGVDEASERQWGTAAAVTACVVGGADVVRVHDVREMGQVVGMAGAVFRVVDAVEKVDRDGVEESVQEEKISEEGGVSEEKFDVEEEGGKEEEAQSGGKVTRLRIRKHAAGMRIRKLATPPKPRSVGVDVRPARPLKESAGTTMNAKSRRGGGKRDVL